MWAKLHDLCIIDTILMLRTHAAGRIQPAAHGRMRSLLAARSVPRVVEAVSSQIAGTVSKMTRQIEQLNFDNLTLRTLPVDASYNLDTRQVPGACFSLVRAWPQLPPDATACCGHASQHACTRHMHGNLLLPDSWAAWGCHRLLQASA